MHFSDFFHSNPNTLEQKVKLTFANPPALHSERLDLVKISPEHAADMYEYASDPDVTKYLTWSCHSSLKETERYIKLLQKKYAAGVFNDWGLVLRENGRFIGTCGYTSFDYENKGAEIGYVVSKAFWGRGLAAEAAKLVIEFARDNFGITSVCAKCIQGNDSSMRVMQKLGMSLEGVYKNSMFIKGEYKTIVVYSKKL